MYEIWLNGFSISLTHILSTKKPITMERIWDKTTIDSILFIAKNNDTKDHVNKEKNNNIDLLKRYFFNEYFFRVIIKREKVFKKFKYSHWVATLSRDSIFGIVPTIK